MLYFYVNHRKIGKNNGNMCLILLKNADIMVFIIFGKLGF